MSSFSKIIGMMFCIFFTYAAIVQINDIDALRWILLYGLGALISLLFLFDMLKKQWTLVLAALYLALAVYHWPSEFEGVALQDGMKTMNIELGRESLGMGISAVIMLIYFVFLNKKKSV